MVKRKRLTVKQLKLVSGIANGKTATQAALDAGYGRGVNAASAGVQASRELKNPNVLNALEQALDKAGATLEESARVIADALHAENFMAVGKQLRAIPDHMTRLKAAELALKARGLLGSKSAGESGQVIPIGWFLLKCARERGFEHLLPKVMKSE